MTTKDPSGMASDLASEWQTIQRLKTLMGLSWHHKWTCGTREEDDDHHGQDPGLGAYIKAREFTSHTEPG